MIELLLPHLGGKPRIDDRHAISDILHRYRKGLRWQAVPPDTVHARCCWTAFKVAAKPGYWPIAWWRDDQIHALTDGAGRCYALMLTAG